MPRRRTRFEPPHCPNPACDFHRDSTGWRFKRFGFYPRKTAPHRIQRYRCSHCSRTFSAQTFSPTYWLKKTALLPEVWEGLVACSGFRQMARRHGVSPSTIQNHATRLARHALLFFAECMPALPPAEPCAVDGFESFEHSQFYPCHLNLAVGCESGFLYGFTHAELRRKGRMTPAQKKRRAELEALHGRPDPQAIEKAMAELIVLLAPMGGPLEIRSDEHPAYPRAFRRVEGVTIAHSVTSSKRARTPQNSLFEVNRDDNLIRHTSANHKRETIAFSKRLQSAIERLAVFMVWVDFQKSRSEKRQDETPAQVLGIVDHKLTTAEILAHRRFPTRVALPPAWQPYYERRVGTRARRCAAPPQVRYAG